MHRHHRAHQLCSLMIGSMFLFLCAGPAHAHEEPRGTENEQVTASSEAAGTARTLEAYWTVERMAKARPVPFEFVPPAKAPRLDEPTPTGPFRTSPPNLPSVGDDARKIDESRQALAGASPVPNVGTFPYSASGKLFFSSGGTDYACSAGAIGDYVYLTAGHCLYDPDTKVWSQNLLFRAQYSGSSSPYSYGWSLAVTLHGWTDSKNFAYDIGMVRTPTKMTTQIGHMGWMANYPANSGPWTAVGYPGNSPFPGNQMYQATGSYLGGSSIIHMSNNNMHSGSSGGAWMATLSGTLGYANGLNSYHTTVGTEYSPYFGQGFLNAWACAANNQGCSP